MSNPTPKEIYKAFEPFYDRLLEFIDRLRNETLIIFESTNPHSEHGDKTIFNKRYRAIFKLAENPFGEYEREIDYLESLYYQAVERISVNSDKPQKLPIYIPRILDDDNLEKIQVHINKAHSSVNYKKGKVIPIAQCRNDDEKNKKRLEQFNEKLVERGYTADISEQDNSYVLNVSVDSICDDYQCDSIQLRNMTGRQIRASYFTADEDGLLQKSSLKSVGIIIIDHRVAVVNSHERSRRIDAKYVKQHPDEIIFEESDQCECEDLLTGRFYKVKNKN